MTVPHAPKSVVVPPVQSVAKLAETPEILMIEPAKVMAAPAGLAPALVVSNNVSFVT